MTQSERRVEEAVKDVERLIGVVHVNLPTGFRASLRDILARLESAAYDEGHHAGIEADDGDPR